MTLRERIDAFSILGGKISNLSTDQLTEIAQRAQQDNPWFTEAQIKQALKGLTVMLDQQKLEDWLEKYELKSVDVPKIIGIIMAGNIPLVGFHDLLCVLISGHFAAIKASSQDTYLVKLMVSWVEEIEPRFKKNIAIRERLTDIDALIATGSDNTARYFEYYFRNHPKIIRKNRTSVAILDGSESQQDLYELGNDIFSYFGLGCRNVSKIFIPEDYDHTPFFEAIEPFNKVGDHHKYHNNYDYQKSLLLINGDQHLDNGFLLLRPTPELVSPISVLYTDTYSSQQELEDKLLANKSKIQCIVGKEHIPFGKAQYPELWDYADDVDTIAFLNTLNHG